MRLYSLTGAAVTQDPAGNTYEAGKDGGFDLPEDVGREQHSFHVNGKPLWETDIERQHRLAAEELARRQSPEALYEAVQRIVTAAQSSQEAPAAKPRTARKPAASK